MAQPILQVLKSLARPVKVRAESAFTPTHPFRIRRSIAKRYLSGSGIEIGALHNPLALSWRTKVRYVDRMSVQDLRRHYPELADHRLVNVDIIDNGEEVTTVPTESVDFVIANHLLEHTQDPISAIRNWLRVIKPGGVLYMAVPHKEYTFDRDRPVTPLEHVIRDHKEGPAWSRRAHFAEWACLVEKVPEERVHERVKYLMDTDYSIHFHVWTEVEMLRMLLHVLEEDSLPYRVELVQRNGMEVITILRKLL